MSKRSAFHNARWAFIGFAVCFGLVVINHFWEIFT